MKGPLHALAAILGSGLVPLSAAPLNVSAVTWNAARPGDLAVETAHGPTVMTVSIFDGGRLILRDGALAQAISLARNQGVLP